MDLKIKDLHKNHPVVLAAHAMVKAHESNDMMWGALEEVRGHFPEVKPEHLMVLWIGINAKNLEINESI